VPGLLNIVSEALEGFGYFLDGFGAGADPAEDVGHAALEGDLIVRGQRDRTV
jgi:hypothetical protein